MFRTIRDDFSPLFLGIGILISIILIAAILAGV